MTKRSEDEMKREERTRELYTAIRDLSRAVRLYQQDENFCRGITHIQFVILDLIAERSGELELVELHGLLSVDKSTTTRLVDPLVKNGYLLRLQSRLDSRGSRLEITAAGREAYREVKECLFGALERLFERIPAAKQKSVLESLRLFARSLEGCCGPHRLLRVRGITDSRRDGG